MGAIHSASDTNSHSKPLTRAAEAPTFLAVLRGPDHVFEFANEAYFDLAGRRDVIGKALLDALPGSSLQASFAGCHQDCLYVLWPDGSHRRRRSPPRRRGADHPFSRNRLS